MKKDKILIIGGGIVDVMLELDRLPKSSDNIYAKHLTTIVGGCAINIANVLRAFGVSHDLFMPIGNGPYGKIIHQKLLEDGYSPLIFDNSADCSYSLCFIEKQNGNERTFISIPGVEKEYKEQWFDYINPDEYTYAYLSGYDLEGANAQIFLNFFKKHPHIQLIFDIGPRVDFFKEDDIQSLYELGPIIHGNRSEFLKLSRLDDIKEAILHIHKQCKNTCFATLDKDGCLWAYDNTLGFSKANRVEQIDSTGAGDSHMAGCILSLINKYPLPKACSIANDIASIIVQKIGARFEGSDKDKIKL